ncbi:hypothetical protein RND81_12G177000 [Saponaria officinalis]|uniref:Phospholipase A(2) n=1 Tax=Saponaria officinalis TaxID=3572 RepID=A0AAW1HC34_SAPOF
MGLALPQSLKLPNSIPWLGFYKKNNVDPTLSSAQLIEEPSNKSFDFKLLGISLLSIIPWAVNAKVRLHMPTTINKDLKRRARSRVNDVSTSVPTPRSRFRPYVSKVPWHTGARAFLSMLFPRYGHYCGPNWSSGKDGGSLVWDKRPIDWLDYCCYCHDMGYDTHDQAKLLEADLAFLECLEKPRMQTRGDKHVAFMYRTMCIQGLRNILVPYRTHLVRLQSGPPLIQFGWLSDVRWKGWTFWAHTKAE